MFDLTGLLAAALLSALLCSISAAQESAKHPVLLAQGRMSTVLGADVNTGVFLCREQSKLVARALDTGEQRWAYQIPKEALNNAPEVGLHNTLLFSPEGQLVVIDHKTGNETHRLDALNGEGTLQYACLDMDDRWVNMRLGDNSTVMCELATRRQFRVPSRDEKPADRPAWVPNGETLPFIRKVSNEAPPYRYQVWRRVPGNREPVAGVVLEYPAPVSVWKVLPNGDLLLHDWNPEKWKVEGARVVNPESGATVRVMERPRTIKKWMGFTRNGARHLMLDRKTNQLAVHDTVTGEHLLSLALPGNTTMELMPLPSQSGVDYLMTWDERGSVWLTALETDAVPKRLVDGTSYLPGRIWRIQPPYMFASPSRWMHSGELLALYSIEGCELISEWHMEPGTARSSYMHFDSDPKKCLVNTHGESTRSILLEDGLEEPLWETMGSAVACSPNGKYYLMNRGHSRGDLVNIETGDTGVFFEERDGGYVDTVAFSPDSGKMAVFIFNDRALSVVDLVAGYPSRRMAIPASERYPYVIHGSLRFSPDGAMLLAGTYGKAWLFNANTGELLQTFDEPRRFAYQQQSQEGFMQKLGGMAEDFAGKVTDRFKKEAKIYCAFTMGGLRAVTVAQEQLVRVWDVRTGGEVASFKTGLPETRNKQGSIDNASVFSRDAAYLFAYNGDGFGLASLLETATGRKIQEYRFQYPYQVRMAGISDDGRTVYAMIGPDLHFLPGRTN